LANSNCGVRDALNIAVVVLVEREARLALGALSRDVLAASTVERAHLARILISHEIALDALIAPGISQVRQEDWHVRAVQRLLDYEV
jgi:hypothetical protein